MLFSQVGEHLADNGRLLIQYPMWFKGMIERLGAERGLKLVEVKRMPLKSPGLLLLSLLYMQFGFRSAFYLMEPMRGAPKETNKETIKDTRLAA
jgi:release factor glutamine methyltransferase